MVYRPRVNRKRIVRKRKYAPKRKAMPAQRRNMRIMRPLSSIPFPKVRPVTLTYKQPSITLTSSALTGSLIARFRLNSLFDFDLDNYFDDKQPLYFDQLFSDTGPYKYYKVNAWKTTVTVTNLASVALHAYYDQGTIGSLTDADTALEANNRPGVQYRMLTASANAKPQCVFSSYKTTKSFAPRGISQGLDYGSSWNNNPANPIISTLLITNLDPASLTTFQTVVQVNHVFYATAYLQDAIRS